MAHFVPPEIDDLVSQIGDFIEYWGFKNVQGRIWAHLFLSAEPLDAADLMKRLDISKALVSISIKEMLEYEVIEDAGKSDRGTTLYRANPDQERVILNVLRRRERMMLNRISSSHKLCRSIPSAEKAKLHVSEENLLKMGELIGKAELALDLILSAGDTDRDVFWSSILEEKSN